MRGAPLSGRLRAAFVDVAVVVAGLALLVAACGHSPREAFSSLLGGAFGSIGSIVISLLKTGPLLWTGLGVTLAFRAGVWNIGAEGQFYAGALGAAATALALPPGPFAALTALAAGALAGALWGFLPAALKVRWGVSEVLGTIMLNFVALELVSWAVHGPLQESSRFYPQSERIAESSQLAPLLEGGRLHWGIPLALLAAAALHVFLTYTSAGFRLRAAGFNPRAARLAGIAPETSWLLALCVGGGLAGAGGASELLGVTHRLYERFSAGYGYTAIAVALLGGLEPAAVVLAALFFGALEAGSGTMQRVAGIPSVLVTLLQGAILVLLVARRSSSDVAAARRAL
ncbi:MAG: ABC transporter permease [Candidatus Wallbacteria bacterium]|nr:ABC transporter permease [Candidatus Wallbacteria bacterium]